MSVITISRQFGAGGKTLSKIISKKLGYPLYDDEIVRMISEKARVSKDWVLSLEKNAGSNLMKIIDGLVSRSLMDRIIDDQKGYIDERIYIELLEEIICTIAKTGNCIILGREGQYILEDKEDVYHILLIAKKEDRIKFMEKPYNLSHSQSIKVINTEDKKRARFYRNFNKTDYDAPIHYHMVLNMSRLDMEKAAQLVYNLTIQ